MHLNSKSLVPIALFGGLLVPGANVSAQNATTLVVPGKSLGRVSLGMTQSQVHKLRGRPRQHGRLSSTLTYDIWFDKSGYYDTEVTYKAQRVVQIETASSKYRTGSGLFAQSRMDRIDAKLQPLVHSVRTDPENYILHYFDSVKTGLAFEWSGPKTGDVRIDDEVSTLIVHRKGVPVIVNRGSEWISSSSVLVLTNPNEDEQ